MLKPGELEDRRAFLCCIEELLEKSNINAFRCITSIFQCCICLPQNEKAVSTSAIQTSGDAKAKQIIKYSFLEDRRFEKHFNCTYLKTFAKLSVMDRFAIHKDINCERSNEDSGDYPCRGFKQTDAE